MPPPAAAISAYVAPASRRCSSLAAIAGVDGMRVRIDESGHERCGRGVHLDGAGLQHQLSLRHSSAGPTKTMRPWRSGDGGVGDRRRRAAGARRPAGPCRWA